MGERSGGVVARGRAPRAAWVALAVVVGVSLTAHFVGWHRDLPSPEADEPYFVLPAVQMASSGSLDPHWFGHPGSTVIAPLAVVYRAREVVLHGAPLFGAAPSIAARFRHDPSDFVLVGRLWTIALSVASVVALFVLARRLFDDTVAIVAALCYALVPLVVNYGRMVRSDSAGALFGLLALTALVAMADRPTRGRFALAGGAIGLAVASRYFLIVLLPIAVGVWFTTRTDGRRPRVGRLLLLGGCALALFAVVTPYFFLDWHAVERSLHAETVGAIGNDDFSVLDNVVYYLTRAIPEAIGWPAYLAACVGLGWCVRRRDRRALVAGAFVPAFLAVICVSSLHWQRWIITIVPVLLLFAAFALVHGARSVAASRSRGGHGALARALLVGGVVVVAVVPATALVRLEQSAVTPSTRALMRSWIITHVPRGSQVAVELRGPELRTAGYRVAASYDLPGEGTVADYLSHGYHYLVVNAYLALDYRLAHRRYPEHAAFYEFLRRHGELLHETRPSGARVGPHLKLYRVEPAQLADARGGADRATTRRSKDDRISHPTTTYPVGNQLLN